jgi:hypothetical protein
VDFEAKLIRFRRKQVRGVVGPISKKKPAPKETPLLADTLQAHKARMEKLGYSVEGDAWIFPSRKLTLKQPSTRWQRSRRSSPRSARPQWVMVWVIKVGYGAKKHEAA